MSPRLRLFSVVISTGLLLTSCVDLKPGETGMFGTTNGASAAGISHTAGMTSAESMATGASSGSMVAATTYIIAKHQASERQRQIAEQRARAACAWMTATRVSTPRHVSASQRVSTSQHGSGHAARPAVPTRKKLPRYIAVDTVKDEKTSPRAQKSVMIWDTQAEQVVGNNVYDVQTAPAVGSTARFETYSAEYVGSGI